MRPTKSQFMGHKPEVIVQKAGTVGAIAGELQAKHDALAGTQGKIAGNFIGDAADAEAKVAATGLGQLTDDIAGVKKLQTALQTGGQGLVDAQGKVTAALASAIGFQVDDNWKVTSLTLGPYTPTQISARQSAQEKIDNAVNAYSAADDNAASLIKAATGTVNGAKGPDWGKIIDTVLSAEGQVKIEGWSWDPKERKVIKDGKKVWRPGEGFTTPSEDANGDGKKDDNKKGPSASAMWNLLEGSVVTKEGKTEFTAGDLKGEASYRLDLLQGSANAGLIYKDGKVGFAAGAEVNVIKAGAEAKISAGPVEAKVGASTSLGADASLSATVGKDGLMVDAGAFAGGKAGVDGSLSVAGFGADAGAGVSYGIGADGGVHAGVQDGKLELGFNGNVSVGLGFNVEANITVDPGKVVSSVKDAGSSFLEDFARPFNPRTWMP